MNEDMSPDVKKPLYKNRWFVVGVGILLLFLVLWLVLQQLYPTTSPILSVADYFYAVIHPHKILTKQTIAFMPYWRIPDSKYAKFDLLSEINYFSLSVDENGNFISIVNNQTDPGWLQWNSQTLKDLIAKAQINGDRFSLTIANQRNRTIEGFLKSPLAQQHLIANIISQINARNLNGIVLDFEYDGTPDEVYKNEFTQFSSHLSETLHKKTPHVTLSLTLLPLSGRKMDLFDLPKIKSYFNSFIGMSYDYYAQNSDIAGPVAPMNGFKEKVYFFDVTTTYQDYLQYIPKEKMIMGIPYYGYDWAVMNGKEIKSKTLPTTDPNSYAAVLSYARMREDKDLKPTQCSWDTLAKETWCWYTDANKIDHQVWFENNQSLQEKYIFAQKNQFAGVGIWAMGYDKAYPDLWNILENTFKKKSS